MPAKVTAKVTGGKRAIKVLQHIGQNVRKGKFVKVGHLEARDSGHRATYPETDVPIAQVAAWQEFGTITAPARPTFQPMIDKNQASWGPKMAVALKMYDYDTQKALDLMGLTMADELVESIVETAQTPLSEVTLMIRKMKDNDSSLRVTGRTVAEARARVAAGEKGATGTRAKPLMDTGVLQRNPAWKVEK
jgi:hypothetical protein